MTTAAEVFQRHVRFRRRKFIGIVESCRAIVVLPIRGIIEKNKSPRTVVFILVKTLGERFARLLEVVNGFPPEEYWEKIRCFNRWSDFKPIVFLRFFFLLFPSTFKNYFEEEKHIYRKINTRFFLLTTLIVNKLCLIGSCPRVFSLNLYYTYIACHN